MPRPLKNRSVHRPPLFAGFNPTGVRGRFLETLPLTLDEFEAMRLADHEGQDHSDAALAMGISRSTFPASWSGPGTSWPGSWSRGRCCGSEAARSISGAT